MKPKKDPLQLKNLYTGDVVLCQDYNDYQMKDNIPFIKVYNKEKPDRVYLVNREAFKIIYKY